MNNERVVIIIPTYNEALIIEQTIKQVFSAVRSSTHKIHVLVFDSCSTDSTQDIVYALQKNIKRLHLLTEQEKTGLGSAYLQAMNYALNQLKASIIIEFDADLSHQPCYLLPLIRQLSTYDVVIGSRYVRGGNIPANWRKYRKLLSKVGNTVSRVILTHQYKDFTSGFRATRSSILRKALPTHFISNDYAYKLELLWNLHLLNAKILEYPIAFIDREQGRSKLPTNSILDALKVLLMLRFKGRKTSN